MAILIEGGTLFRKRSQLPLASRFAVSLKLLISSSSCFIRASTKARFCFKAEELASISAAFSSSCASSSFCLFSLCKAMSAAFCSNCATTSASARIRSSAPLFASSLMNLLSPFFLALSVSSAILLASSSNLSSISLRFLMSCSLFA